MRLVPCPPGNIANGKILFHQKDGSTIDLLQISENEMRGFRGNELAMIFQEPMTSLNPVFTCGDQVMEAIMLHQNITKNDAKNLTIKLLKKFNYLIQSEFSALTHIKFLVGKSNV